MPERCWAFLAADFEAAARRAQEAVGRLQQLACKAAGPFSSARTQDELTRASLKAEPEWIEAQRAIASQLTALAALEEAGLAVPEEALQTARRAQAEFMALSALE